MGKTKRIDIKPTRYFWCYWLVGLVCLLLGVALIPSWAETGVFWRNIGARALDILLAVALFAYIFFYLVREASREGVTSVRILLIVEIAILALIGVGCILKQFRIINIGGVAATVGAVIWLRGVVLNLRAYLYKSYSVLHLALAVALITMGAVLVVRPLFSDLTMLWLVAVVLMALGIVLIAVGTKAKPKKAGKK